MIIFRTLLPILLLIISGLAYSSENSAHTVSEEVNNALFQNRNSFALLYFVQPGCVYCQHQQPVIEQFQKDTNWYVKTIDITQNPEVKSKFNINGTPVIVLIKRNAGASNWQAVSIGYSALNTLRTDVFNLVRLFNGHTSQSKYYVRTQRNESTPIR